MKYINKYQKQLSIICLFSMTIYMSPIAYAGGLGGGATEVTQIANNAQLIGIMGEETKQAATLLEKLQVQVQQYAKQLEQLKLQTDNWTKVSVSQWTDAKGQLAGLASAIDKGQAISFSLTNVDEVMRDRFKSYTDFLDMKNLKESVFADNYKMWSTTVHDTVEGAMKGTNLQYQQFEDEESTMSTLRGLNDNAVGQMQALQVGNMIAGEYVNQLQKMRALLMLQNQLVSTEMKKNQSVADEGNAALSNFLTGPRIKNTTKPDRELYGEIKKSDDNAKSLEIMKKLDLD